MYTYIDGWVVHTGANPRFITTTNYLKRVMSFYLTLRFFSVVSGGLTHSPFRTFWRTWPDVCGIELVNKSGHHSDDICFLRQKNSKQNILSHIFLEHRLLKVSMGLIHCQVSLLCTNLYNVNSATRGVCFLISSRCMLANVCYQQLTLAVELHVS